MITFFIIIDSLLFVTWSVWLLVNSCKIKDSLDEIVRNMRKRIVEEQNRALRDDMEAKNLEASASSEPSWTDEEVAALLASARK